MCRVQFRTAPPTKLPGRCRPNPTGLHILLSHEALSNAAIVRILAVAQEIVGQQALRPTFAPIVYRYPVGVGFVLHHDEVTNIERERAQTNNQPVIGGDLTCSVLLSEPAEYVGGTFVFPDHAVSLTPEQGDLIIFPATRRFMHEITSITRGARYSLLMRLEVKLEL